MANPPLRLPLPAVVEQPFPPAFRPRRSVLRRRSGGAWKVAYADFVTALMALFIVLWLMNSSRAVKQSVAGYFHDPKNAARAAGNARSAEPPPAPGTTAADLQRRIEDALRRLPEFNRIRQHIQFSLTPEGLRIDLMETEQGMFFVTGSPTPTPTGKDLLRVLAGELASMGNQLVVEGHTDSRPFRRAGPSTGYSNWDLSSDRANAARRLLHAFGVRPEQVVEVRGFADQRLLRPATPTDAANRRVSVVVKL